MKKLKTSKLTGVALDYAVAIAEGKTENHLHDSHYGTYSPSTNWNQCGKIIVKEGIRVGPLEYMEHEIKESGNKVKSWKATRYWISPEGIGPTPLIAACRCYVASMLGDRIAIPEELL